MTRRLGSLLLAACVAVACSSGGGDKPDAGADVTGDGGTLPDGGEPPPPTCTRLVPLRQWTTNPSAVALLYRAEHCDGGKTLQLEPAPGKLFEMYDLSENDSPLSSEAVPNVTLSSGQRVYVSLLLDFSASTNPVKGELLESARAFASTLLSETSKAYIELRIFDGRAQPHTVVRATRDLAAIEEALTALRTAGPGAAILGPSPDTGSTNLNGAFLNGITDLQRWQQRVMARNANGVVSSGYLVVFTDGADTSERVTGDAAMAAVKAARAADGTKPEEPNVQTYAVALAGADFTATARERMQNLARGEPPPTPPLPANNRYFLEGQLAELTGKFTQLARRIAEESEATHLLTYCSPARAGQRTVTLRASAAYGGAAADATGLRFSFAADGFAPGCAEFFQTVCEDKECGGFNCGACNDATDICRASDGRCVDECVSINQCSGEVFTNELGYARTCGGDGRVSKCSGQCIDSSSDPANCGGCGVRCTVTGSFCDEGSCACPEGTLACGGECKPLSFFETNENCGACGLACTGGATCAERECACPGSQVFCDGACRDEVFFASTANCGTCGNACTVTGAACLPSGECECAAGCTSGASCVGGACQCPAGKTACNGTCVDTKSDKEHCGSCGRACGERQWCNAGVCDSLMYAPCGDGVGVCEPGYECVKQRQADTVGFCARECTGNHRLCDADESCVAFVSERAFCLNRCRDDGTCSLDSECSVFLDVCLPR